ncbi:MAG: hypothetical protein KY475_13855 [Planctomycetes bacterium]|nr:hypothetical protein [Planctomycetota bacterium]
MADRMEEYLRRMLEGYRDAPPAKPDPKPQPSDALEAQVEELEATPEPPAEHLGAKIGAIAQHFGEAAEQSGSAKTAETNEQRAAFAADIARLLRSPQRIREAIVLNEILKRPFEW